MLRRLNLRWSITARLVFTTVIIASFAMAIFTVLIVDRLDSGFQKQKISVRELARTRLSQQLQLQARLLTSQLDHLAIETRDSGYAVAAGQQLGRALKLEDPVLISQALQKAVKDSPFNSLILLDRDMNFLGSNNIDRRGARPPEVIKPALVAKTRGIALGNDQNLPFAYSGFEIGMEEDLRAHGIEVSEDRLVIVTIHPVFNRMGEVIAVLCGQRLITGNEPELLRVDETGAFGLRIIAGNRTLLSARLTEGEVHLPAATHNPAMGITIGRGYLYKCQPFRTIWRLCVYKPETELIEMTDRLVSFIRSENTALLTWLLSLAAVIMVLSVVSTWISSNRIIAPLKHMAHAVRSVAKGNWLAEVQSVNRNDEVGEIARALAVLQKSMKERERLRSDVADLERLKSRQSEREKAVKQSQSALRQSLFNLSDLVDAVELTGKRLAGLADLAGGEADETRLVVSRGLTADEGAEGRNATNSGVNAGFVVDSIDRLSETITELNGDTQGLSDNVTKLIHEVQTVDRIVRHLTRSLDRGSRQTEADDRAEANPAP